MRGLLMVKDKVINHYDLMNLKKWPWSLGYFGLKINKIILIYNQEMSDKPITGPNSGLSMLVSLGKSTANFAQKSFTLMNYLKIIEKNRFS